MGEITTKLDILWKTAQSTQRLIEGKTALLNTLNDLISTDTLIQMIVNEGAFTGAPPDVLSALNVAWQAVRAAITAMNDPLVQEALKWKSPDMT